MKKIFLIITTFFILTSCQSIKDGLSGKKNENSDEFLVQKKNPLVLPPSFSELPKPNDETVDDEISKIEEETDIQKILDLDNSSSESNSKDNSGSAEDFGDQHSSTQYAQASCSDSHGGLGGF